MTSRTARRASRTELTASRVRDRIDRIDRSRSIDPIGRGGGVEKWKQKVHIRWEMEHKSPYSYGNGTQKSIVADPTERTTSTGAFKRLRDSSHARRRSHPRSSILALKIARSRVVVRSSFVRRDRNSTHAHIRTYIHTRTTSLTDRPHAPGRLCISAIDRVARSTRSIACARSRTTNATPRTSMGKHSDDEREHSRHDLVFRAKLAEQAER